ncbi:MAG: hypothetical protein LBM41_07000 [Ruminococcus sp.]|jgi:hypothetical protein|nr:hypothetical protein [Ruminococcus sp.]
MDNSIGTLNERSVHAFLKLYFEPNRDSHEIKIGGFVADIVGENGIIEIQTGSFGYLKKKLKAFLEVGHVTVVYPVITGTTVINTDTGRKYKSPRKKTKYNFLSQAYNIREFLADERLHFVLVLMAVSQEKSGSGKTASKSDRKPEKIIDEITLESILDWHIFTDELPESFNQKEFEAKTRVYGRDGWGSLQTLISVGLISQTHKEGNTKIYKKLCQKI